MSGPIDGGGRLADAPAVVLREGREAEIGEMAIRRVLPTKGRRTVGAWCFVDLMVPDDIMDPPPMEVGPHPHIGLSTVTWLLSGEALHSDSLGTEQVIRPGQLNLMTAGHGIAHAELGLKGGRGVQMWVAQPEGTRHGGNAFEHHAELPRWQFRGGEATVLMGRLDDVVSPAQAATPVVGAQFTVGAGGVEIPVEAGFEHAVVPLDGPVRVAGEVVDHGWIGLVDPGPSSLTIDVGDRSGRFMLLGGEPLGERIQMWWNFVARTRDEITDAWRAWQDHDDDRFPMPPSDLGRIDAPTPHWVRQ